MIDGCGDRYEACDTGSGIGGDNLSPRLLLRLPFKYTFR